jgi:hypothetical protein
MTHVISLILSGALLLALAAAGLAHADEVTLRVGDQKAGLKALLEVSETRDNGNPRAFAQANAGAARARQGSSRALTSWCRCR